MVSRLINISDEVWMFGVSDGTLEEITHTIKNNKPVYLKFDGFDSEWGKFYKELGKKYDNPLEILLN